jgi:hypothetical protein
MQMTLRAGYGRSSAAKMINRLIETGRYCGMERNVGKTKVMRLQGNHPR